MDCSLPGSSVHSNSPGKNTGAGCHTLLQGDLPDPGIEPGSPALQADSLPLSYYGSPHNQAVDTQSSWNFNKPGPVACQSPGGLRGRPRHRAGVVGGGAAEPMEAPRPRCLLGAAGELAFSFPGLWKPPRAGHGWWHLMALSTIFLLESSTGPPAASWTISTSSWTELRILPAGISWRSTFCFDSRWSLGSDGRLHPGRFREPRGAPRPLRSKAQRSLHVLGLPLKEPVRCLEAVVWETPAGMRMHLGCLLGPRPSVGGVSDLGAGLHPVLAEVSSCPGSTELAPGLCVPVPLHLFSSGWHSSWTWGGGGGGGGQNLDTWSWWVHARVPSHTRARPLQWAYKELGVDLQGMGHSLAPHTAVSSQPTPKILKFKPGGRCLSR